MHEENDTNVCVEPLPIKDFICPVCGKNFIPAPFHQYKVSHRRVCSYTCQLRGERNQMSQSKGAPPQKPVLAFDLNGKFLKEYNSPREAARAIKISEESVRQCCRGTHQSAGGFVFKYKPKEEGSTKMTYQEREEILSKEALHISDFEKLFGLKYNTATKLLKGIKVKREIQGRPLRLNIEGYIHTLDYLEEIGIDQEQIQERYVKKKKHDVYDEIASADEAFQKKIYTYS